MLPHSDAIGNNRIEQLSLIIDTLEAAFVTQNLWLHQSLKREAG